MEKIKIASLFCGCGGTDVGILGGFEYNGEYYESLNTEVVYANDIDENACNLFQLNFGLTPDNNDIREIPSSSLPEFDILTGGFPCQSFSVVAQNPKRLGITDDKGKLFFEICRILRDRQPKCFLVENVKGLLSANKGEAFPLIIDEFINSGYQVASQTINSAQYGVPQKRERVIIVGFRNDLNHEFHFPAPTIPDINDYVPLKITLEESVPEKYYFSERAVQGMLRKREKMNKGRAQDISKPCNTVGSHLAKVSLNSTDPVLAEGNRYRRFTPREVARIQSFPDTYKLEGSDAVQYRALGNAIPPVMIWHIMKAMREQLALTEKKSKQELIYIGYPIAPVGQYQRFENYQHYTQTEDAGMQQSL